MGLYMLWQIGRPGGSGIKSWAVHETATIEKGMLVVFNNAFLYRHVGDQSPLKSLRCLPSNSGSLLASTFALIA